jgi:hypothetical protein
MGMMYAHHQERAAHYLIQVLLDNALSVRYSYFYDGSDEANERIRTAMGIKEGEDICAELALDLAADALAEAGIVTLTDLTNKLADGEPDYRIEIPEEGLERLEAGEWPKFRHLDM